MFDSRLKSACCNSFTRRLFDIKDIEIRAKGDDEALHRIRVYKIWYGNNILSLIWYNEPNEEKGYRKGVCPENYECIRYHAPILVLKFKSSICLYLYINDGMGSFRYETYMVMYEREFDNRVEVMILTSLHQMVNAYYCGIMIHIILTGLNDKQTYLEQHY